LTILALCLASPGAAQQPGPEITIFRTWRPPNATVVEGLFRVDAELLGTTDCAYQVELQVRDSAGKQLVANEWQGRCPIVDGAPAPALETFEFAVVPATYTVAVTVAPEARPSDKRTGTITVEGLQAPLASDLILANAVGYVDSANASTWTIRYGTIGIQAASRTVVAPADPSLAFYFEVYPPETEAITGAAWGIVRRPDGKELARVQLAKLDSATGARPIAGRLPVAGLPPGSYLLEASLELSDTTITRSGKFEVSAPTAVAAGGPGGRTGYFSSLSDEELERQFAPLVVWLTAAELRVYETLSPAGKREFLARQFGTATPDPNDGTETALEVFLERSNYVNEQFTERTSQATMGPWETDRGRVWLIRGEPTTRVTRPNPQAGSPYEIWFYSQDRSYAYLFADETKMGHFRLIFTNDPNQQGVSNWARIIGNQAIQDMQRLGVILPRTDDLTGFTGGR